MTMMNEVLDILFQVLIVSPSMQRILQPGKYSRTRGICYAVLFLATIAIGRVSYEMMDQKANYYQALKVDRDCTLSDLKRGYRAQSVALHPDKNPSPSAADDFNRLREAFDVLSDDTKRKVYDLFGEEAAQDFNGGEEDVLSLDSGVQFISFYVLWGVLTYLFTMGAGSSPSRTWVYCACMLTFITELNLTYGKMQLPKYFSRTATFQAISMLHSMYPLVLNGCRSLGGFLHFDMLEENFAISLELLQANKAIFLSMREIDTKLETLGYTKSSKFDTHKSKESTLRQRKSDTSQMTTETSDTSQINTEKSEDPLHTLEPAVKVSKGFEIPQFVYAIGLYAICHYIFG